MKKAIVIPISSELWKIEEGECFADILHRSQRMEHRNEWAKACELRFEGAQQLLDIIGEEEVRLDWDDKCSRAAMELLYRSAADNLFVGEVEVAVALWESLLDLDPEDHLEAIVPLAFAYVEIEDYDCLESALFDISPKSPEYHLLMLWAEYRRSGGIERDSLRQLRTRHKEWWGEFVAEEHPADERYLKDCQNERPSQQTEAREFWFATQSIWERNTGFIKALQKA